LSTYCIGGWDAFVDIVSTPGATSAESGTFAVAGVVLSVPGDAFPDPLHAVREMSRTDVKATMPRFM
jgi:hypothetical protein